MRESSGSFVIRADAVDAVRAIFKELGFSYWEEPEAEGRVRFFFDLSDDDTRALLNVVPRDALWPKIIFGVSIEEARQRERDKSNGE